ncbi:BON domain-containing protein [Mariprofundus ferrinatatus]|nr:BON domain-containing protein [Mariprofundus ferrinatatus]
MFSLTGCFTAVVGGTAVATNSIHDERKIGTQFDDAALTAKIDARLIAEKDMPSRWVSVQVIEGNATLTGHLPSQSHIDRALYITKSIDGVRSVRSELLIGEPAIKSMVSDTWITTKVKTMLLNDEQVSGLTIKVETVEGKVYLQGIVEDFVQRQRAKDLTNAVDGVTAIIDLMQIAQK